MSTKTTTPAKAKAKARTAWANLRAKSVAAWRSFTAWAAAILGVGAAYVDVLKEELPAVAPYLDAKLVSALAVALIVLRVRSVKAADKGAS